MLIIYHHAIEIANCGIGSRIRLDENRQPTSHRSRVRFEQAKGKHDCPFMLDHTLVTDAPVSATELASTKWAQTTRAATAPLHPSLHRRYCFTRISNAGFD